MSQITDYMGQTWEQRRAERAAFAFGDDNEKVRSFLLTKRQQLDPLDGKQLRNARFDPRQRWIVGKNGYRLEWRLRADRKAPINDETNPQYPHGIAVLTKPQPTKEMCAHCGKRPGEKTNSQGTLICLKCADYSHEPARSNPQIPPRNKPCHCGSGKKYKQCHMPRPGIEFEKLVAVHGEPKPVLMGESRQRPRVPSGLTAAVGALVAIADW